ncbi:MAG: hypothetical protein OEY93_04440 [Anaerolineae bacterium]|nr:hypothetical protein [Anaerolineae bacterium]
MYTSLFGNPWEGAVEPSPPKNLEQPEMILPFLPGHKWTFSEGLLPCSLGGWQAVELPEPYKGALINGEQTITSCQCSTANTKISRPRK